MCSIKKDYDGQRFSGDTEIKSFRFSQGIELWYLYNTMYSESHVYCHGYIIRKLFFYKFTNAFSKQNLFN